MFPIRIVHGLIPCHSSCVASQPTVIPLPFAIVPKGMVIHAVQPLHQGQKVKI